MGTWGLGDMGFRMGTSLSWGHGFRGYGVEGDMGGEGGMGFRGHGTENIHFMGTWGLGHMGTWGSGDMGFRWHGTEDIHTFGDIHHMGTWV